MNIAAADTLMKIFGFKRVKVNMSNIKSEKLLKSFSQYCINNPELRFWQALRSWSKWGFIFVSNEPHNEHNEHNEQNQ